MDGGLFGFFFELVHFMGNGGREVDGWIGRWGLLGLVVMGVVVVVRGGVVSGK